MKIIIEEKAGQWFKESVGMPQEPTGIGVRFRNRIYGDSPVTDSFGLAIELSQPQNPVAQFQEKDGYLFFVEASDEWFFDGHDLRVSYDASRDEPIYIFEKDGQAIQA
ncbi:HesB/YadR/YfhF family protein [Eremococcus coleocola]|uniref:HesB-like protein n=1 Tax=Eremococcus coleocola ACS-139-V-Col8 TaxID=908337 RepID=E4KP06_9LACT|nr:hypothetical protein [Eremococcus coleocola]EFR30941.1 HesB-like protein [Eremococcus coleocola ACS-139-V-Col8]